MVLKTLLRTLSGLLSFCLAYQAIALPIQGTIVANGNKRFLKTAGAGELFSIQTESKAVISTLGLLQAGDYVWADGELDQKQHRVRVINIDFVGLSQILGLWRTEDHKIYFQFYDFRKFYAAPAQLDKNLQPVAEYHYRLAPSSGQYWNLFVAKDANMQVGTLNVVRNNTNSRLVLRFINPKTGQVKARIKLLPVSAK